MKLHKQKLWKRIVSIVLAVVIALITPLAVDFTSKIIKGGYDFDAVLSAYAAEIVDLDTAVALNEEVMHADSFVIDLYEEDGTNTLYLFSEPISYVDEEGILKTKDITVEEQTEEALLASGCDYTNGQNDYRILFSSNSSKGVKVQSGNCRADIMTRVSVGL